MFKCKHHVAVPEKTIIHCDRWIDGFDFINGILVSFHGFCARCKCYVVTEERHRSIALYNHYRDLAEQKYIADLKLEKKK
jgi:hypothetical protein